MAAGLSAHDVWALDCRGHGATAAPAGWTVNWNGFAEDALAAARSMVGQDGTGTEALVGFGHSMGGAALLMAAHQQTGLFRALVLYEPIVFPPVVDNFDPEASPLIRSARRRRRRFDSFEDAIANYASKPPMSRFEPTALDAYVRGGFAPVDPNRVDGPVELTCDPEFEAATFATSHGTNAWAVLPDIDTPTVVIGSRPDAGNPPASLAAPIAERLGDGRYHFEIELDHFGPFVDPRRVADLVRSIID